MVAECVRSKLDDLTEDVHFVEADIGSTLVSGVYKGLSMKDGVWFILLAPLKGAFTERVRVGDIRRFKKIKDLSLWK
jgi:hypothetical protein